MSEKMVFRCHLSVSNLGEPDDVYVGCQNRVSYLKACRMSEKTVFGCHFTVPDLREACNVFAGCENRELYL